jgi:glycerophosphoryl diester phosphodiesterase
VPPLITNVLTDLDGRLVIAHRGNSAHAPENTLESFAQAVALGVDALELDVRVTRDDVAVVIHDPTLARTTDRGDAVAAISYAQLRRADAGAMFTRDDGATFPYRSRGLTIPTLAEVLAHFPDTPLLIEVKVAEAVSALERALAKAGAKTRVVAASMRHAAVSPLRAPGMATGASAREVVRLLPSAARKHRPSSLPYDALCIPLWYYGIPVPVAALARVARSARVVTHVWTIDAPDTARSLWAAGVQGVVTNDPATMMHARAELAAAR